jgi:hypothetical protein
MGVNVVTVSGRVSRPPRRVRGGEVGEHLYVFPIAVRQGNSLVFPVVVSPGPLPEFAAYHEGKKLHEQPLVTVVGRVCTRDLTQPLHEDLAAQARRAGASQELVSAIRETLAVLDLKSRRVVTEIVADVIHEGGVW